MKASIFYECLKEYDEWLKFRVAKITIVFITSISNESLGQLKPTQTIHDY